MPMVKKSISITDRQDRWIKAQIETGGMAMKARLSVS